MGGNHGGGEGIRPRSHIDEAGEVWKGLEHLGLRGKLAVSTGCALCKGGRSCLRLQRKQPV